MAQGAKEISRRATSSNDATNGVRLMDLRQGSEEEAAELSGIVAEAIENWLTKTTLSSVSEIDSPEVCEARDLARRYRYPYIDLSPSHQASPIQDEILNELPIELMLRYQFVPLRRDGKRLHVAIADPTDLQRLDELSSALQTRIVPYVTTAEAIELILRRGDATQRVLREAASDFRISLIKETENGEEVLDLDRLATDADMSPIVKLVDTIIFNALESRASDIHIETGDSAVSVKFRIDGALYERVDPIDLAHHERLISRIKIMSELDIAERRVPQDGRFRVRYKGRNEEFRNLRLDVIGFSEEDLTKFRQYIAEPYGMVLVTGPTGSGKTTTLYAALNEIRNTEDKIVTIEDPIEYQLQGITQIPVNEKKGLTFARGLRSILRHDPDKIMIGEVRDSETAQIAIQSALTGHLVFTTVHANNVIDVIGRFLNMGVEPYNFISSLNCVLAQRLVRVICSACKRPHRATTEELLQSGLRSPEEAQRIYYVGIGCSGCNYTGYRGRTAIHELLGLTDNIRDMIVERRPASEIRRAAQVEGLSSLRASAVQKLFAGITTFREINRVTFPEEAK